MKTTKKAIWPALLSAFVAPGVGQIANRDYAKGFFLLASSLGSFFWFSKVVTERLSMFLSGPPESWAANQTALREALMKMVGEDGNLFLTFQVLMVVIWVFGVVDAYMTARKNFPKGPVSSEDPHA